MTIQVGDLVRSKYRWSVGAQETITSGDRGYVVELVPSGGYVKVHYKEVRERTSLEYGLTPGVYSLPMNYLEKEES